MPKNEPPANDIDWRLTTWEGSRREQLRRWAALPLERIILAIEEMQELTDQFRQAPEMGKFSTAPSGQSASGEGETYAVHQTPAKYGSKDGRNEATSSVGGPEPLGDASTKPQAPEPSKMPPDKKER